MSQALDERADALDLDVIVVGAGQAGLASGYFLQQAGVRFRLFDGSARVGDSWRRRYDSLVLFSPRWYSALPGLVMQGAPDGYPDKDEIANYLERYADRFGLPVALQERITRLEGRGDGFIGQTSRSRHVTARAVIVATGPFQRSVIPPWAVSITSGISQLGADAYRNPGQLRARRVLVVGGGGSGRQVALELARSHEVSLSVGRRIAITPQRVLGRDVMVWFDRFGVLRADKATARGRFARAHESFPGPHLRDSALRRCGVRLRPRTVGAAADGFVFADGSRAAFDAVIWAGGYEDDARWLRVPGAVDAIGQHVENRGVSPTAGLFYVGRSWQTSRASALLCGVGSDAARMVGNVMGWLCHDVDRAMESGIPRARRGGVADTRGATPLAANSEPSPTKRGHLHELRR
jgi:putative flavoprotein involved in K+ transport